MTEYTWLEIATFVITSYALGWGAGFVILQIKRAFDLI